jgi:hypothetical protein
VVYPKIHGSSTGKESKELLGALARNDVSGQIPQPAFRAEHITRHECLRGTVLRFLVGQVDDVEVALPLPGGLDFAPRPVQMWSKPALEPYVILKDKHILMITRRDLSPKADM